MLTRRGFLGTLAGIAGAALLGATSVLKLDAGKPKLAALPPLSTDDLTFQGVKIVHCHHLEENDRLFMLLNSDLPVMQKELLMRRLLDNYGLTDEANEVIDRSHG